MSACDDVIYDLPYFKPMKSSLPTNFTFCTPLEVGILILQFLYQLVYLNYIILIPHEIYLVESRKNRIFAALYTPPPMG